MAAGPGPVGWLRACASELPSGDTWLGGRERAVLAGLRMERRRADWRLGRYVAKRAVAARSGLGWTEVEILAAPDGAPEAWHGTEPIPLTISFSHRAGWAAVALAPFPVAVGCDLELVEPRSDAFVAEWLSRPEQDLVRAAADPVTRDLAANLVWTGKEAAAKVLREGLRLEVRRVEVSMPGGTAAVAAAAAAGRSDHAGSWHPIEVHCPAEGVRYEGWWWAGDGLVATVLTDPGSPRPPQAP